MNHLVESEKNPGSFLSYRRQVCPHCGGERFREEGDVARFEPFDVFRAENGSLWKFSGGGMAAALENFVCLQCEQSSKSTRRPRQKLVLVGFDRASGEEVAVEFPMGEVHWGAF